MEKYFQKSLSMILYSLLFIFPFFFLNLTQEFYITNKLYLLVFGSLLLLLLSVIYFLLSKKLSWKSHPFDGPIILFLMAVALSTIVSSPNKIQALLNPNFGLVSFFALVVLYFFLSRISSNFYKFLQVSNVLLSLITIVFFFQPFKNTNLPAVLQFLKNPGFTPLGSRLDLAIFLGFFVVLGLVDALKKQGQTTKRSIFNFSLLTFNLLALFLTLYSLLKPITDNRLLTTVLPPFRLSWYAAVETLKRPLTALFGVGVDNFSSMFTAVKDIFYNQSNLWQINSFSVSRSTFLHIMTETGILGLFAFGLLVFSVFKQLVQTPKLGVSTTNLNKSQHISLFLYLFICLLIFPPSLIIWFLFFVMLAQLSRTDVINHVSTTDVQTQNFASLLPIYIGIIVIAFGLIAGAGYFLGRSYASEYYFKKSLDGYLNNNAKEVYDNQRQAILLDPYIERFRTNFSQTNLMIANNIASKATPTQTTGKETQTAAVQLTDQDRQTITQAIQTAISEAKAAVTLNSQKADNWENLAAIYRNVLAVAQGADAWTVSAYQRAIVADPQNPIYRLNLGGVYYTLKDYNQAASMFQQSAGLKPDWANAHYNFAWASYQKADYQLAATEMQNVLTLIDPKTNKADYDQAQKDLEEFKKKLPEEKAATEGSEAKPSTLNLPSPPNTQISPKLELPKEASPEAR